MTKSIAEKPLVNIYTHHKQCFTSSTGRPTVPEVFIIPKVWIIDANSSCIIVGANTGLCKVCACLLCASVYSVHHHHSIFIKIHIQSQYKSTIALLQFKYKQHNGGQETIVRVFCYLCLLVYNTPYVMFCSAKEEEASRMPAERPEGCHHYTPCHVIIKPLEELQSDQQSNHFSFNT